MPSICSVLRAAREAPPARPSSPPPVLARSCDSAPSLSWTPLRRCEGRGSHQPRGGVGGVEEGKRQISVGMEVMLPSEATSAVENRRVGVGLPRAKEKRRTTGGLEDKGGYRWRGRGEGRWKRGRG